MGTNRSTNLSTNLNTLATTAAREVREEKEHQATGKPSANLLTQHNPTEEREEREERAASQVTDTTAATSDVLNLTTNPSATAPNTATETTAASKTDAGTMEERDPRLTAAAATEAKEEKGTVITPVSTAAVTTITSTATEIT